MLPSDITVKKIIVPFMQGMVMCHILCKGDAPSILAASKRDVSTPDNAARYKIVPQPSSFHTAEIITIGINHFSLTRKSVVVPKSPFISPLGLKSA